MENEGILLRQAQHMKRLISQLNDQIFAKKFGDIKLVFADGDLYSYKSILSELSPKWGQMLRSCDGADLVLLEEVRREEFLCQMMTLGKEKSSLEKVEDIDIIEEFIDDSLNNDFAGSDVDTELQIIKLEDIHIIEEFNEDSLINNCGDSDEGLKTLEILEDDTPEEENQMYSEVTGNLIENDLNVGSSDKRLLSCIVPNFTWPNHLNGPNFHSIRWGPTRSTLVFDVMGNRSIFTVLSEKNKELPCTTAFFLKFSGKEEEILGTFNLKDFANSGADTNISAFMIEGSEDEVTQTELLKSLGYGGDMVENAKNINILLGGQKYINLKDLAKTWKNDLLADTADQELIGESRMDKDVVSWLQSQATKTSDGGEVCCYCGFVCFDQSLSGNFTVHMKKHLYRKKYCKPCKEHYTPLDKHICSIQEKAKAVKVPCTECEETFSSRGNLVVHLKRLHNIVDKVVTLRECVFCYKKVPNISNHYYEFHRNEKLLCQFCDKTFTNPTKFKSHVDNTHKKIRAGFCVICQKDCGNLNKHNLQCHNEKTYKCDHCDKVFKHAKTLEDHMKSVNGTREKKPCPECGNLYVNLNDHVRRFHRGHKKKTSKYCNCCQKFIKPEEFDAHKLACKLDETICHICSKKVVMIAQHLAKSHKVFQRKCYLCNEEFLTALELDSHLRSKHFPKIMIEAEFLESDLHTEDKIQREFIATKFVELYSCNAEESKIECKFCGYKTTTGVYMIVHMKKHLGFTFRRRKASSPEKEKLCPDCGKIVKWNTAEHRKSCKKKLDKLVLQDGPLQGTVEARGLLGMTVDMYKQHRDGQKETVVELEFGEEEIKSSTELLITHSEETKKTQTKIKTKLINQTDFSCDKCEKIFKKQAYLRKHIKNIHGEKHSSCELKLR